LSRHQAHCARTRAAASIRTAESLQTVGDPFASALTSGQAAASKNFRMPFGRNLLSDA
jgi:hypothetical protein